MVWIIVTQTLGLVESLPGYKNNIQTKIVTMKKNLGLGLQKTTAPIEEFIKEIQKLVQPKLDKRKVIPVEVVEPPENFFQILSAGLIPFRKATWQSRYHYHFCHIYVAKAGGFKRQAFSNDGFGAFAFNNGGSR